MNPLTPVQCRLLADYIEETLPDAIGTLDDVSYAMISDLVALHDQLMEGAKAVHERS